MAKAERGRGLGGVAQQHLIAVGQCASLVLGPVGAVVVRGEFAPDEPVRLPGHSYPAANSPTPVSSMCLGRHVAKRGDVHPGVEQSKAGQAAFEELRPDHPADLGGGSPQAGLTVALIRARPQRRHQVWVGDRVAALQGEQAQQVGGLAGAPLAAVDDGAVPAPDLKWAQHSDLQASGWGSG